MPELPDVEGFARVLHSHVVGQRIEAIRVLDPGVIRGRSSSDFVDRLCGRVFREPARTGKWLVSPTDGPTLLLHFGMTGSLVWETSHDQDDRFARVIFETGQGMLVYQDMRKLRGLWLAESDDEITRVIDPQGPDALGLTGTELRDRLAGRRAGLKGLLMDQTVVAGLGNMLSDEVLWRARIHPARRYDSLDTAECRHLDRSLQQVLRTSVTQGSIPRTRSWLSSQRGAEAPRCPRGHGALRTSRFGGRTAYWCPVCQPSTM
jgi:formamidopyrimidine-DNA glycosylase